jgi:hypothetical protein
MLLLFFVEVCLGKEFKSEMHLSLGRVIGMRGIGKGLNGEADFQFIQHEHKAKHLCFGAL